MPYGKFYEVRAWLFYFLGATEASYTYANHTYDKLLFDNLLNKGVYNIGDLNIIAHIKTYPKQWVCNSKCFCYVCGGDPSLEIYTQSVKDFENVNIVRSGSCLQVKVGSIDGFSVSVVTNEGVLMGVYSTPNNIINLNNIPSDAHLILNKHNYVPYEILNSTIYIQNETIIDNKEYISDKLK